MSKGSKSKRNIIKGKDAVQPGNGKERMTISKVSRELGDRKD
ncbi:hypothetical protein [Terrilactibacillus laevilacticus]|uniref:Uncharacterized protein n=1 Tax=Terrilactibacillus laevilacticus TaxID=1380157 RepID=A0ABW5PUJ6_9BACI|nr:hypothetical protein [Terrilactibacillus laevilacticus]